MSPVISNIGTHVDLDLRAGSDFKATIAFTNADGTPVDLTGTLLSAALRKYPLDETPVASFVVTVPTPAAGLATLSLTDEETAALPCGNTLRDDASRYHWDLKFVDAAGNVSSPMFGRVRVAAGVTR